MCEKMIILPFKLLEAIQSFTTQQVYIEIKEEYAYYLLKDEVICYFEKSKKRLPIIQTLGYYIFICSNS